MQGNVAEQYYNLINVPVLPNFQAVDNLFIRQLINVSIESGKQGNLLSVVAQNGISNRGQIAQRGLSASDKSVFDICKFTPLTNMYGVGTLQEEIAMYRYHMNRMYDVTPQTVMDNRYVFMVDYLLASSLCYIEVFDGKSRVDKFLATRNLSVVADICKVDIQELQKYQPYLQTITQNYTSGQLKVLKISKNKKGYKVSQPRGYVDFKGTVKVTPVFIMTAFLNGVMDLLKTRMIKFTYIKDNMMERTMTTTLNKDLLSTYYDGTMVERMLGNVEATLHRGHIHLPELGLSKYDDSGTRALNLTRITKIEFVDTFNSHYIDVDMKQIMPSIKETIYESNNPTILEMIHEDIVGKRSGARALSELQTMLSSHIDTQYAVGTTTYLRYLHDYMVKRDKLFPLYRKGERVVYNFTPSNFNIGIVEEQPQVVQTPLGVLPRDIGINE